MIERHASILLTQLLTGLALFFVLNAHESAGAAVSLGALSAVFLLAPHLISGSWAHGTAKSAD